MMRMKQWIEADLNRSVQPGASGCEDRRIVLGYDSADRDYTSQPICTWILQMPWELTFLVFAVRPAAQASPPQTRRIPPR
jgi:hypothetical protein